MLRSYDLVSVGRYIASRETAPANKSCQMEFSDGVWAAAVTRRRLSDPTMPLECLLFLATSCYWKLGRMIIFLRHRRGRRLTSSFIPKNRCALTEIRMESLHHKPPPHHYRFWKSHGPTKNRMEKQPFRGQARPFQYQIGSEESGLQCLIHALQVNLIVMLFI